MCKYNGIKHKLQRVLDFYNNGPDKIQRKSAENDKNEYLKKYDVFILPNVQSIVMPRGLWVSQK